MDLKNFTQEVVDIVRPVKEFIAEQSLLLKAADVIAKGDSSLVSYVDKTAEEMLVKGLNNLLPEAQVLAEEGSENAESNSPYRWIIDPLDGTTNYVHQIAPYAISVALEKNGELLTGVVWEVVRNECFTAWKNGGAYLNGRKIQVSQTDLLKNAVVATGFPYSDFRMLDKQFELLNRLTRDVRGIRRLGAAAVDLAYVACGRLDVYFEYSIKPWDIAAGCLLVTEAGGSLSNYDNEPTSVYTSSLIATNGRIHKTFMEKFEI